MTPRLTGLYTALVTPFKNGEVDIEGFIANLKVQEKAGVDGVVVLGTTGESPTLREAEQELLVRTTVEKVGTKMQVIVGTGASSTAATVEKTMMAKKLGADAALVIAPYYNRPTQRGLFRHFETVARAVDMPIIAYNHPPRTGTNIEPLTMVEIAQFDNIIGIKECNTNLSQVADTLSHIDRPDFSVVTGLDDHVLPLMAMGGHGLISIASNLVPEEMVALVRAAESGDYAKARTLYYALHPLFKGLNFETNPIPIKTAMNLKGMAAGDCRLPLTTMSEAHTEALRLLLP